ncbi:MAG: hypothetical protein A3F72_20140 [Bacteroidetes bacterium RIFCSPLOWO2_12_FULL_35_15]|nr:MAG: hypothetical protein A3F72_20140 [Bacteroidetes bacterium RIFCSPLOWO2_12_FULL_35_15]
MLYLIPLVAFFSIEFYGAYFVNSGFHIEAICEVNTNENSVALSFDDGPMPIRTEKVLTVLKKFNAKATFFLIGNRIKGNESLLLKMDNEGHLMGNHSFSHSFFFDLMSSKQLISDLQYGNNEIQRVIGKTPLFFRPPYGVTTPGLAKACRHLKFDVIGWNVRSLDTSIKNKEQLLQRVKQRIKPGSIILFHDTVDGIDLVLEDVLNYLKEKNYTVIPLDKLIQKNAYS